MILPMTGGPVCLGLLDKYVGFTAVESVHDAGDSQTVILRESGRLAWVSETIPKRITANGVDVTEKMQRSGMLTVIPLEEKSGQTAAVVEMP